MSKDRLYQIDKFGNLTFAKLPPSKIDDLKAKGRLLTFDQLTLPQRRQAQSFETASSKMLAKINEIQIIAKQLRKQAQENTNIPSLHVVKSAPEHTIAIAPELLVGNRLKQIRTEHGYSQQKLGELAGINNPDANINHYEKGRHQPSPGTLKKIADVFRVPMAYFYAEDDGLAAVIRNHRN
jgi:DNA-binding XRE family transcriptional regulator